MGRNIVHFELRAGKDDDIDKALNKLITKTNTKSRIIRFVLRQYLFQDISTSNPNTERVFIEPLNVPSQLQTIEKDDTQLDDALDNLLNF